MYDDDDDDDDHPEYNTQNITLQDVMARCQAAKKGESSLDDGTVMFLSFRTDMPGQTVQTQIRLLLEEQSDQGLHCLPFRRHRLDSLLCCRAT